MKTTNHRATNAEVEKLRVAAADATKKVESWPGWKKEGLQFATVKEPINDEETMKSDEVLADLLTKWDHCPMEDVLHIGDSYPCDNVPQPKSCKHCLLDWARNKAEESERKPITYTNPEDA